MIGDVSRTRAVVTALSVILVLLVAGCTDDDPKPKFEPSPSSEAPTSPSASPTAGTAAPSMPDAAKGTDAAAAEAFVAFYWDTVNYAQASGDLSPLQHLADPTCTACKAGVEYLEDVHRADGRITGGDAKVRIQKSTLVQGDGRMNAVVKFVLITTPQRVDYPGTEKDESYPGGQRTVNALVQPSDDGWVMSSWGVQQ